MGGFGHQVRCMRHRNTYAAAQACGPNAIECNLLHKGFSLSQMPTRDQRRSSLKRQRKQQPFFTSQQELSMAATEELLQPWAAQEQTEASTLCLQTQPSIGSVSFTCQAMSSIASNTSGPVVFAMDAKMGVIVGG